MMKSLNHIVASLTLAAAALGLLSACNQESVAPAQNTAKPAASAVAESPRVMGIGLVDTDKVFSQSLSGKAGIAHLENIGKELQQEFVKMQGEVKEKDEKSMMSFQKKAGRLEQRFKAEERQVMSAIEKLYQESLDNVRQSSKLQLILPKDSALSFDDGSDVTAKVLAEMDKTTLTFKPLPVEDLADEAEVRSAPLTDDKAAAQTNATTKNATTKNGVDKNAAATNAGKNASAKDGKDSDKVKK